MYQNLPEHLGCNIHVVVQDIDDPLKNANYSYAWEIILPADVADSPITLEGGGSGDTMWRFAAPSCEANGLSDSGLAHRVRLAITGNEHGNSGTIEADFGIGLLGDVNNDGHVNVADRSIANAYWRTGSAGVYTLRDVDVNGDGVVNVTDRSIINAVWRGTLCSNSVSVPCPLR